MNATDLHNYQKHCVEHIKEKSHCGLILDMGLGKTVSTLTAIEFLIYQDLDINAVLVIAPKRVAESVWSAEIDKWEHLSQLSFSKIIGTPTQRRIALQRKADIYLIGRDNVVWLEEQLSGKVAPFNMLVVDESSSFKSPKSKRFKSLRRLQPRFRRVVLLTGTPAPNGLIDLWSQIWLLDRGERLGRTLTMYRDEYFTPGMRNGAIVYNYNLRKGADKRIHKQIDDICVSMKAQDYLELKGVTHNVVEVNFDDKLQSKYDNFEEELVLDQLESGEEISALSAATLSNKLQQFANGAVYVDDGGSYEIIHDLKLDVTEELIEAANGKPVLIAYTYRHDLERLMKRLEKYKPVKLETDQHIKDWNAGKINILIMHPASGGHGLNLQDGGNNIIWYGQNWSLELYQQLNARLNRQGQTEVVVINRIVAAKTIDQGIIKALENKDKTQSSLMAAIKARISLYDK